MKWTEWLSLARYRVGLWILGPKGGASIVHGVVNKTLKEFPEQMADETLKRLKAEMEKERLRARTIEPTEENIRRAFGMSGKDLFKVLAASLGYEVED